MRIPINIDDLQLDHLNNNGKEDRIMRTGADRGGWSFYQKLKQAGFPNKESTKCICGNCNNSKEKFFGKAREKFIKNF